MIHVVLPFALASILAGAGVHAVLARRNAVLMLIGVELVLAAANLILVTASAVLPDRDSAGQVLAVFIITLAAAEVTLALGIILFAFRQRGHIDLTRGLFESDEAVNDGEAQADGAVKSEPVKGESVKDGIGAGAPATDAGAHIDPEPEAMGAGAAPIVDGDAAAGRTTPDAGGPR